MPGNSRFRREEDRWWFVRFRIRKESFPVSVVKLVIFPFEGVTQDVFSDLPVRFFIADNMLIIITLPDG